MVTYYLFYLYFIPLLLSEWKENKVPPGVPDPVRPFFAPLTALKKELDDELRKKDTVPPSDVYLCIYV
jgi:hypothetical protein